MQIADSWLRDMPQQFQGKHNIEVLVGAFARQMQELEGVFRDLNAMTDVGTAAGKNLDYVGTIIPLTRKEAGELDGFGAEGPVIPDERYRKYLQYKMLRNTSECTYHDIMRSIEILWDVDRASYHERPDRPATIFIGLPLADIDEDDPAEGRPEIMKPGGVGFIYAADYSVRIIQSELEDAVLRRVILTLRMPFLPARTYDGSSRYDGSTRYDAKRRYELGMRMRICLDAGGPEGDIGNMAVETRRDVNYYDGKIRYDGSVRYDAMIRKDVIE